MKVVLIFSNIVNANHAKGHLCICGDNLPYHIIALVLV